MKHFAAWFELSGSSSIFLRQTLLHQPVGVSKFISIARPARWLDRSAGSTMLPLRVWSWNAKIIMRRIATREWKFRSYLSSEWMSHWNGDIAFRSISVQSVHCTFESLKISISLLFFYKNGFVPRVNQLVERIMKGL